MTQDSAQHLLAVNMKKFRKNLGWTQSRLAEEADLSDGYIRLIETQSRWVGPKTLIAIAHALSVNVCDLFRSEMDSLVPKKSLTDTDIKLMKKLSKKMDEVSHTQTSTINELTNRLKQQGQIEDIINCLLDSPKDVVEAVRFSLGLDSRLASKPGKAKKK